MFPKVAAIQAAPSQTLPSTYDFGRHRRILDLGGGTGSWLRAILRQYSNLEGTLFELPPTATVARQHLASDPATRQVKVVEGDLFKDRIPAGHDVVLIANVMHLLSAERNLVLLRLTRQCVPDGGRLLLADVWTDATHTQPAFAALMAGEFLVGTGEGDVYSEEEARAVAAGNRMASVGAQAFGGAPGKCDCGRDRRESWRLKAI